MDAEERKAFWKGIAGETSQALIGYLVAQAKETGAAEERIKGLEWLREQNRVLRDSNQVKDAEIGKKAARILELEKAQREWRAEEDNFVSTMRQLSEAARHSMNGGSKSPGVRRALDSAVKRAKSVLDAYVPF